MTFDAAMICMIYKHMKVLPITILLLLTVPLLAISASPNIEDNESLPSLVPLEEKDLGREGREIQEDEINEDYLDQIEEEDSLEQRHQLSEWVAEQLKSQKNVQDFPNLQSFIVHLMPEQTFEYKWNLASPKSKKRSFSLLLQIFTYEMGDDPALVNSPQEYSYVEVDTKTHFEESYQKVGKVYVTKAFPVIFDKDSKFMRFTNRNDFKVLVQINMEMEPKDFSEISNGVIKNSDFALPAEKLSTIFQEFKVNDKNRRKMFKWEWGFFEREERYDAEMLKLTGVELLVMLVTAIAQMYVLKSLFDKNQII